MSNYTKITKHPQTSHYELAEYKDDYYGPHLYGVYFASDAKVYPEELVQRRQIYDFWMDDVVQAYREVAGVYLDDGNEDDAIINFLNEIQRKYQDRWKRDPLEGEGATTKSAVNRKLS